MQEIVTVPLTLIVVCHITDGTAETVAIPFRIPAAFVNNPPRAETLEVPLIDPLDVLILIAAADTVAAPDKLAAPCLTLNPSPTMEVEPETDAPLEKMPVPAARTVAMPLIDPEPNLTLTPLAETVPSPVIEALET
jgi:hypothetical protein